MTSTSFLYPTGGPAHRPMRDYTDTLHDQKHPDPALIDKALHHTIKLGHTSCFPGRSLTCNRVWEPPMVGESGGKSLAA